MSTRSASTYEPLALLDVVREVAEGSAASKPTSVSQRNWDRARVGSYAAAPPARRISEYLGLRWAKVLEVASMKEPGRAIAIGRALGEEEQDWLTPEYAVFALKLIAGRLERTTLLPREYEGERKTLLDSDGAHWLHGRKLHLPNHEQLCSQAGSWDAALLAAGLEDSRSPAYKLRRPLPSIIDILERCYEAHGTEPNVRESEIFARANRIPYVRRTRPWEDYLREWKDGRRSRGLPVPDGPPPKAERPDYASDVGARSPDERRHGRRDDFDEAVGWVMRYLAGLVPRERATQRGYDAWARTQDGAFYKSTFQRHHGGWAKVRDAARERLLSIELDED